MHKIKSWKLLWKAVIFDEELDGIDKDDIGNVEDLLRVVFIDAACVNSKVVTDWWWRAY